MAVKELWKSYISNRYQVSNLGRLRGPRGLHRPQVGKYGYVRVHLTDQLGVRWPEQLLHVIVANLFLGQQPSGCEVNHKDLNKENNKASNLEYTTRSDNQKHYYRTSGNTKLRAEDIIRIRQLKAHGVAQSQIAEEYGVCNATISMLLSGKRYTSFDTTN